MKDAERARAVIPGGVNSGQRQIVGLEDLIVTATAGATFTDAEGRVYIDYHAAFGPPLLGHNDADVDRAVATAGRALGNLGVGVTPVEIRLAEKLTEVVPSVEKVLLTMTGSEATFHALRLARTATGRRYVVKFQGCYHGWHDSVAMNVISPAERIGQKDPLSAGILPEVVEATLVVPFNDAGAVERVLDEHAGDVAAIILEPIPHNIGAVLPQPGFLQRLRELATRHGVVLIFDEVITGFRVGPGGAQGLYGVRPDLTVLGKIIGGGLPVGAYGGRADLLDLVAPAGPVYQAGTLSGHPVVMAAGEATMRQLDSDLYAALERHADRLATGLRGLGFNVARVGSLLTVFFRDRLPANFREAKECDSAEFASLFHRLRAGGVLIPPSQFEAWFVSAAHDDAAIEATLRAAG